MNKNLIILVVVILVIAVSVFGYKTKLNKEMKKDIQKEEAVAMKSFSGEVKRFFEGDNILKYSLNIPETSSTTVDKDGALIKIIDNNSSLATIYLSYEGGRGFTPIDYINEIITPHVAVITPGEEKTMGEIKWQTASSDGSYWHIGSVLNSQWLVVIESKKVNVEIVNKVLESIKVTE